MKSLLIANRGEIAIRIARAAAELGLRTVAVYSEDDAEALHPKRADRAHALRGVGPSAYLDGEQLIAVARETGCDAVHPGYGFLAESAAFARRCAEAGLVFVGPRPELLDLFGDKAAARALAARSGVPVLPGSDGPVTLDEARAFLASLGTGGAMMIKAVAGGGGRGMRVVHRAEDVDAAFARCASEAQTAFGNDALYVERLLPRARHVEVQIVGDGSGDVIHLWERECSLQRRHQKLVEIAPSPSLAPAVRAALLDAAVRLARAVRYDGLGTFEFLVADDGIAFIEANPRLQVEHTVTEEVTGVDLVRTQLRLAAGRSLADLGLEQAAVPPPIGFAIQARVNMEVMDANGEVRPAGGRLAVFEPPSGPGMRVDTAGYGGWTPSPRFDSLLAKVVGVSRTPAFADAVALTRRALGEFRIEGAPTNLAFLERLLEHPDVVAGCVHTGFVEEHAAELAVAHSDAAPAPTDGPEHTQPVLAPVQGLVVSIDVAEGDVVRAGQQIAVLEAMKMEFVVRATTGGAVRRVAAAAGEVLLEGAPLVFVEPMDVGAAAVDEMAAEDLDAIRLDLAESRQRHAIGLDAARPDAVARRRATGQRTARENIADLCDEGSFVEYGALALAAQRSRRSIEELLRMSPADGIVSGIGAVNGALFDDERARAWCSPTTTPSSPARRARSDHKKLDRMLALAAEWRAADRALRRGRRRAARRHRRARRRRARHAELPRLRGALAASCRASASSPAAASPATPRCSAAATSSSPPRTATSAWAGRR